MTLSSALNLGQTDAVPLAAGQLVSLARQRDLLSPEEAEKLRQATALANRAVHGREVDPDAALDAVTTIAACIERLAPRDRANTRPARKESATKTVHVVRGNGGWEVRSSRSSRASTVKATQGEAVNRARDIVYKAGGGEVVIHGADGRVRAKDTVAARDPRDRQVRGDPLSGP
ncbi:DUF2188 domain-containing protein [Microbacterium foliorum]|uniref:DUF2188 domain-containing protein n=1 Tax=Microbacterium foliorum TaxID=104336 RepID=UPI00338DD857